MLSGWPTICNCVDCAVKPKTVAPTVTLGGSSREVLNET